MVASSPRKSFAGNGIAAQVLNSGFWGRKQIAPGIAGTAAALAPVGVVAVLAEAVVIALAFAAWAGIRLREAAFFHLDDSMLFH